MTVLDVEGEELDLDLAVTLEDDRRFPVDCAVERQSCFRHDGHRVVAVSAEVKHVIVGNVTIWLTHSTRILFGQPDGIDKNDLDLEEHFSFFRLGSSDDYSSQ